MSKMDRPHEFRFSPDKYLLVIDDKIVVVEAKDFPAFGRERGKIAEQNRKALQDLIDNAGPFSITLPGEK